MYKKTNQSRRRTRRRIKSLKPKQQLRFLFVLVPELLAAKKPQNETFQKPSKTPGGKTHTHTLINTQHFREKKEEKSSTEKHLKQKKNSRCVQEKKKEKECISIYEN
jgi:hypothetical protein